MESRETVKVRVRVRVRGEGSELRERCHDRTRRADSVGGARVLSCPRRDGIRRRTKRGRADGAVYAMARGHVYAQPQCGAESGVSYIYTAVKFIQSCTLAYPYATSADAISSFLASSMSVRMTIALSCSVRSGSFLSVRMMSLMLRAYLEAQRTRDAPLLATSDCPP